MDNKELDEITPDQLIAYVKETEQEVQNTVSKEA